MRAGRIHRKEEGYLEHHRRLSTERWNGHLLSASDFRCADRNGRPPTLQNSTRTGSVTAFQVSRRMWRAARSRGSCLRDQLRSRPCWVVLPGYVKWLVLHRDSGLIEEMTGAWKRVADCSFKSGSSFERTSTTKVGLTAENRPSYETR